MLTSTTVQVALPVVVDMAIHQTNTTQSYVGADVSYDTGNLVATVEPKWRDKKVSSGGIPAPYWKGAVLYLQVSGTWTVNVVHSGGMLSATVTVTPAEGSS